MVYSWLAYNFLLENKTYILVRRAFHLREPCDVGICISQYETKAAHLFERCESESVSPICPQNCPQKGLERVSTMQPPFCTHGTKSVLSLGTQHHQAQQNNIVTHKL